MQISHTFFTDYPDAKDSTLKQYLSDGWKVVHFSTSGNSNRFCFSYILEKNETVPRNEKMRMLPITLGNAQYGIKRFIHEHLPPEGEDGYCDATIVKKILSDYSNLIDKVADALDIVAK